MEKAAVARNEQLRADLLRSISHDLPHRYVLFSGNDTLLHNEEGLMMPLTENRYTQTFMMMQEWLVGVENLLSVIRLR